MAGRGTTLADGSGSPHSREEGVRRMPGIGDIVDVSHGHEAEAKAYSVLSPASRKLPRSTIHNCPIAVSSRSAGDSAASSGCVALLQVKVSTAG